MRYSALMLNLREAVISAARVVGDNFGKSVEQLETEYKPEDGDTARTVIDRYAQKRMEDYLSPEYPNAVYNLEETDVNQAASLEGKLLIFGDPFDGTANAQPRLPLSTQGLIAAYDGKFVAAAALHPFEKYVLFGAEGNGVFRAELSVDNQGEYHLVSGTVRALPNLGEAYERIKSGKEVLMPYLDAIPNPVNFDNERKTKWLSLFIETLDSACGGRFKNARMPRMMGSNIDACMKLAEGRLHVQLTDNVGGIYDVAAGAVFLPMLGGVMSDMYGNPLSVPKTASEMQNPPQPLVVASIHPELHEDVLKITQQCFGADSQLYYPKKGKLITVPEYTGFREWDAPNKKVLDSLMSDVQ